MAELHDVLFKIGPGKLANPERQNEREPHGSQIRRASNYGLIGTAKLNGLNPEASVKCSRESLITPFTVQGAEAEFTVLNKNSDECGNDSGINWAEKLLIRGHDPAYNSRRGFHNHSPTPGVLPIS